INNIRIPNLLFHLDPTRPQSRGTGAEPASQRRQGRTRREREESGGDRGELQARATRPRPPPFHLAFSDSPRVEVESPPPPPPPPRERQRPPIRSAPSCLSSGLAPRRRRRELSRRS
uniref:Uncharacterized protein n=1 Tax=Oryza punctata TaxID=4537 RepID=A0A0E0K6K2_ORYPU